MAGTEKPSTLDDAVQLEKTDTEVPPFTLMNVVTDIVQGVWALAVDTSANKVVVPMVVCLSSIACKVIISKVKYTEIDFSTYMQQIDMVNAGALDYSIIEGDSGPIVYPAGFILVYQFFYWLTDGGAKLRIAQVAFGYLFSITVLLTSAVYSMTNVAPPWTFWLLLGSKRLFSIYVLRMFNDCFTTVGIITVILLLQAASFWSRTLSDFHMVLLCGVAADVFSMALSVKMNVLLYLPAFAVVVYFLVGERPFRLLGVLFVIPVVQVIIGWRFLLPMFWDEEAAYLRRMYLTNAFNFSRKFLYRWTVNWRFVSEETFLSDSFEIALLAGHVSVLIGYTLTRFVAPKITGKSLLDLIRDAIFRPFTKTVSPKNLLLNPKQGSKLILLIFSVTNLIGVLFARSLHYQFLSWYCWLLPFLIFASGCNPIIGGLTFLAHEWCWNNDPSTAESSQLLIAILTATIFGSWNNSDLWFDLSEK